MSKEKIKTLKCIECKEEFYSNYDKSEVCPTCYYKNKQKEKDQKITDLEAKLAEKEEEIEGLKASSDKNIDYLIEFASLIDNEKDCNRMLKALDRVKKGKKYVVDKDNQDKISFAVEKLQEVKEWVDKMLNGWKTNKEVHPYQRDGIRLALENVEIKIDNKIKSIKEGK